MTTAQDSGRPRRAPTRLLRALAASTLLAGVAVTTAIANAPTASAATRSSLGSQPYYFGGSWQLTDTCTSGWCAGGAQFAYPMQIKEATGASSFTGSIPGEAVSGTQSGADVTFTETEPGYTAHFTVAVSDDDTTFDGGWTDTNGAAGSVTATHTACVDGCDAPEIDSITTGFVNDIQGGNTVTIVGKNFENPSDTLKSIEFDVVDDGNGEAVMTGIDPQVVSDTTMTVVAPDAEIESLGEPDLATTINATFSDDSSGAAELIQATIGSSGANDYLYGHPTVTDVTPSVGPVGGGTLVKITGDGFENPFLTLTNVDFDPPGDDVGADAMFADGVIRSDTMIYVNAPSAVAELATLGGPSLLTEVIADFHNAANSYNIVSVATGDSAQSDQFLFGEPEVDSITPPGGALDGGDTITINGSGFDDPDLTLTGVSFQPSGGGAALAGTDFRVASDDQITVTTPDAVDAAGGASMLATTVTATFDDTSGTGAPTLDSSPKMAGANDYVFGQPVVDSVSAPSGSLSGGDEVTITGSGFMTPGLDFQKVVFDNDEAPTLDATSAQVVSDTKIVVTTPDATAAAAPASSLNTAVTVEYVDTDTSTPVSSLPYMSGADDYVFGAPVITAADPLTGRLLGDQRIIITGSGFEDNSGLELSTVDFIPTDGPDAGVPMPGLIPQVIDDGDIAVSTPDMEAAAAGESTLSATVQVVYQDLDTGADVTATPASPGDDDFLFGTPTITSVSPVAGKLAGGDQVLVTGNGFDNPDLTLEGVGFDPSTDTDGSEVIAGSDAHVISDTELMVTTPDATAAADGSASLSTSVQVTFDDTSDPSTTVQALPATTGADSFVFGAPVIDSVSPATGNPSGGDTVTIIGTGFEDPSLSLDAITFDPVGDTDGSEALTGTDATVLSDTEITVTSPDPGGELATYGTLATRVDVSFDSVDDASDVVQALATTTLGDTFTYGAPEIDSVSPAAGPVDGGNTITIDGQGFGNYSYVTVEFDANGTYVGEAEASIVSGTELTLTAPDVSSSLGDGSTLDTTLTATLTNYDDTVSVEAVPGAAGDDEYQFGTPVVDEVSPVSGPLAGGQAVTITGSGFLNPDLTFEGVTFDPVGDRAGTGALPATDVRVESDSEILVDTPDATSAADGSATLSTTVKVNFEDTQTDQPLVATAEPGADAYDYGTPIVDSVEPEGGPLAGGNKVTIIGSGFEDPNLTLSGITFAPVGDDTPGGDLAGTGAVVVSDTELTVTAPDATAAAGGRDDLATTVDVSFEDAAHADATVAATPSTSAADAYEYGAPILDSVSPGAGSLTGGDTLTITGSGFENPDLEFNGVQFALPGKPLTTLATGLATIVSDSEITVTTPDASADAEGASALDTTVELQFLNTDGSNNYDVPASAGVDDYVFGGPTIDSVSPAAGSIAGGTKLTITGSGFDNPEVKFKDLTFEPGGAGLDATVVSDTELTVTTPDVVPVAGTKSSLVSTVEATFTDASDAAVAFPAVAAGPGADNYIFGAPVIRSVAPATGAMKGGSKVTITGTGFEDSALTLDDVAFDVGGATAPSSVLDGTHPDVVSDTELTVTAPDAATVAKGSSLLHTTVVATFADTNSSGVTQFVHDVPAATGVDEYDFATGTHKPAITTAATATALVGVGCSVAVRASGYPVPTVSVTGLPTGLKVKAVGGVATISGTEKRTGRYTLSVKATSSAGTATQRLVLTVALRPGITSATHATASVGKAFAFTVKTTGYPAPKVSATGLPPGLKVTTTRNGTALIAGTPTASGSYPVTLTATNSAGSATQAFTLTVS